MSERRNDSFMKRMIITIAVAVSVQILGGLIFYGMLIQEVKANSVASAQSIRTRIILAERHYTKLEVHAIVDRAVKSIHDKLDPMRKDLQYLVREKRK